MAKAPIEVITRLRDIRQAVAIVWWHYGEIYLKGNYPNSKIIRCSVSYQREGHISISFHVERAIGPSPGVYLPAEIKEILTNISRAFHYSYAGTDLLGKAIAIEIRPDIAELDWALRKLKPFMPAQMPPKRYFVRFRVPAVFVVSKNDSVKYDASTGKEQETEAEILDRLKKEATNISPNAYQFARHAEQGTADIENTQVLDVWVEEYPTNVS